MRITELSKRVLDGEANDDERAELDGLLKDAGNRPATVERTMPLRDFMKFAAAEAAALEAKPDAHRAALLKAATAKAAGVESLDDEVTVEVVKEPDTADTIANLLSAIEDLGKKVDAITAPADDAPTADDLAAAVAKAEDGMLAVQLASEVLAAYADRLLSLKGMLDGGSEIDPDDVRKTFDSMWDVRNAVDLAIAAMGKRDDAPDAEALKRAGALIVKSDDADTGDEGEGEGDDAADAGDDAGDDTGNDDGAGPDDTGEGEPAAGDDADDAVEKHAEHPTDYAEFAKRLEAEAAEGGDAE